MTEVPVLEAERRKNHIDLIEPTHVLLPIAKDCLKYKERERPSSEELSIGWLVSKTQATAKMM